MSYSVSFSVVKCVLIASPGFVKVSCTTIYVILLYFIIYHIYHGRDSDMVL